MTNSDSLMIFKEITNIPRPSGKEEKMVDYLKNFAKKYKLECYTDSYNNVIIKKKASYKTEKVIILQGHTDMVCEKLPSVKINFNKDPIKVVADGDYLKAMGTTLGADNGIGVSIILHLLKSNNLKHPNIEAVFTSSEETTMNGALNLNYQLLTGKNLLSLDGTEELSMDIASAGMVSLSFRKKIERNNSPKESYKITITNLKGGHSGEDINKNRNNANKVLIALIRKLNADLVSFKGGEKLNAIPFTAQAIINYQDFASLKKEVSHCILKLKENEDDKNAIIKIRKVKPRQSLKEKDNKSILDFLDNLKNGVLFYNEEHFPLTSFNLAKVTINDNYITIKASLRSSVVTQETIVIDKLKALSKKEKFTFKIINRAPFFEEKKDSYLQKLCKDTYKKLYNKEVIGKPIHAGLEGGVFAQHIKDLDICVIAVDLYDIHSPKERVSTSSVFRVEKWVESILENF